jgi:hypothetical protein
VRVTFPALDAAATERAAARGPEFDAFVRAGFDATTRALAGTRWGAHPTDSAQLTSKIEANVAPAAPRSTSSCDAQVWLAKTQTLPAGVADAKPRGLGDLNGDGLADWAIEYAFSQTTNARGGTTLLVATGAADCFRVVYQGNGDVSQILPTRTSGWLDLIIAGSALTALQGRVVGSWRTRYDGHAYRVSEPLACAHADGRAVPLNECMPL